MLPSDWKSGRWNKHEIDEKVKNILEVFGLTELAKRFPKEMSGGQTDSE